MIQRRLRGARRLSKDASPAEIAHELAHIEGHHAVVSLFGPLPGDDALVLRRDAKRLLA